ncbi:MAG: hypothetical protein IT381_23525 [Deltaproteobacteria bacterium]|nr:hypothetical protein [Deltaproteobacteria bacterium]
MIARSALLLCALAVLAPTIAPKIASAASSSIVLRWSAVKDAVFYDLEIAADAEFKDVVLNVRIAQNGYRWDALPAKTHYFRARGLDETEQPGPWSEAKEIAAVFVTPPLTKPKKNAMFVGGGELERVEFHFELAQIFTRYTLQVATDERFEARVFDESSAASPIIFSAKALGTYHYRFFATTEDGKSAEPVEGAFSIILDAPALLTPDAVAIVLGGEVPLQWTRVRGASGYRVQIASAGAAKAEVMSERTTKNERMFRPTAPGVYTWRVFSEDDRGRRHGPSASRSFTVEEKRVPTASQPVAPPAGVGFALRLGLAHGIVTNFVASGGLWTGLRAGAGIRAGPHAVFLQLSLAIAGYDARNEPARTFQSSGLLAFPIDPTITYEFSYKAWRFFVIAFAAVRPLVMLLASAGRTAQPGGIAAGAGGGLGFGYAVRRAVGSLELRFAHAPLIHPQLTMQTGGLLAVFSLAYDVY